MKYPYVIQSYIAPPTPPSPRNFLGITMVKNKNNGVWVNLSEEQYNTFEEAAAKCEKLIIDKRHDSSELRIVEVVGTFDSLTTVSVNEKREVVLIPIIDNPVN